MALVEVQNVKKFYRKKPNLIKALNGVNLKVEKGEFVSIVGTSGSGKSTLLNIIGGLDKPTEGKVIIDNKNICEMDENSRTIFQLCSKHNLVHLLPCRPKYQ